MNTIENNTYCIVISLDEARATRALDKAPTDRATLDEEAKRREQARRARYRKAARTRIARTDDDLVDALVTGDVAAAEKLRNRYEHALVSLAEKMLGDENEAHRVVEAAFEDACTGWPPERGLVQVWLKRLVRRRAWARRRLLFGMEG